MKRLLNIGSINIDYVYQVPHFLRAGETLGARERAIFMGGKGLNQSVAAARSGLSVIHAGVLGNDGHFLYDFIQKTGIDVRFLKIEEDCASGHTVIQVTPEAENAILYFAGTNHNLTSEHIKSALDDLSEGDFVLIQNEVNGVDTVLTEAKARKLFTVFNPAPYSEEVQNYPLGDVDALIVNETEAKDILRTKESDDNQLLDELRNRFPNAMIFLTLGERGMSCDLPQAEEGRLHFNAYKVKALDTTGAGDTFVGYAMRAIMSYANEKNIEKFKSLIWEAMLAAAISVTRKGAVPSIPTIDEVKQYNVI